MNKHILAALLIAASSSSVFAYTPQKPDESSLSGKAMRDHPGNTGRGTTANPAAQPDEASLSGKVMRDFLGRSARGIASSPEARPGDNSLSGKVMKDLTENG